MERDAKRLKGNWSTSNPSTWFQSSFRVRTCGILKTDFMLLKNVSTLESWCIYQSRTKISESCVICVWLVIPTKEFFGNAGRFRWIKLWKIFISVAWSKFKKASRVGDNSLVGSSNFFPSNQISSRLQQVNLNTNPIILQAWLSTINLYKSWLRTLYLDRIF